MAIQPMDSDNCRSTLGQCFSVSPLGRLHLIAPTVYESQSGGLRVDWFLASGGAALPT